MLSKSLLVSMLITATGLLLPATAHAGPTVSFVLGALIGDQLTDVLQSNPGFLREKFDNAVIFGGRLGWSAFPFAVEGSLVTSPSGLTSFGGSSFDARLTYAEADIQVLLFPGPISPFVGGGIGFHNIKLSILSEPSETVIGYVFGGGVKATFGTVGLRVDLRDHITPLKVDELDEDFRLVLGIAEDTTLHNIELSGGLSINF